MKSSKEKHLYHNKHPFFDRTHPTTETWFYRLDMPEGYKNFSKTKPMKLEHFTGNTAYDMR